MSIITITCWITFNDLPKNELLNHIMILWSHVWRSCRVSCLSIPCVAFYSLVWKTICMFCLCIYFTLSFLYMDCSFAWNTCLVILYVILPGIFFLLIIFSHSSSSGILFPREALRVPSLSCVTFCAPLLKNSSFQQLNCIICENSSCHTLTSMRQGLFLLLLSGSSLFWG